MLRETISLFSHIRPLFMNPLYLVNKKREKEKKRRKGDVSPFHIFSSVDSISEGVNTFLHKKDSPIFPLITVILRWRFCRNNWRQMCGSPSLCQYYTMFLETRSPCYARLSVCFSYTPSFHGPTACSQKKGKRGGVSPFHFFYSVDSISEDVSTSLHENFTPIPLYCNILLIRGVHVWEVLQYQSTACYILFECCPIEISPIHA